MACDITAGRSGKVCKTQIGGNSSIYIWNWSAVGDDPFTYDPTTGLTTAINAAMTQVFEFELEGDNNTYVQDAPPADRNNGSSVVTHTINLSLKKMDAATSATFNLLKGSYNGAVIKDREGNYHAVGIDDGLDWGASPQTGGAKTDMNGYTVTATGTTRDFAPILDSATVTAFLALVA
jgi:hypothetical protein